MQNRPKDKSIKWLLTQLWLGEIPQIDLCGEHEEEKKY